MNANNCATCRWWKEGTADRVVTYSEAGYQYICPAESSECKFNPTPILKGGADFCGQWKGTEGNHEAFFEALGEIFTPPTEEQRAKAEQALKDLLEEWRH
jgi:hypothetical protein